MNLISSLRDIALFDPMARSGWWLRDFALFDPMARSGWWLRHFARLILWGVRAGGCATSHS